MVRIKRYDDLDVPDDFEMPAAKPGTLARGQALFKKHCAQCHTIRKDGKNPFGTMFGPNLYGVMGRTAGMNQRTHGAGYSQLVMNSGILWTDKNMMGFLKNPYAFFGGQTNMNFKGMDNWEDRIDVIHYLKRAGHEDWMVQDGTPHTQQRWWSREGTSYVNYRDLHMEKKDIKPYQHAYRIMKEKVSSVMPTLGWGPGELGSNVMDKAAQSGRIFTVNVDGANDDMAEATMRLQKVENGVKPAAFQQSMNWPLPEDIARGPVRRERKPTPHPSGYSFPQFATLNASEALPGKENMSVQSTKGQSANSPSATPVPEKKIHITVYNDKGEVLSSATHVQ
jgi:cytochrome c